MIIKFRFIFSGTSTRIRVNGNGGNIKNIQQEAGINRIEEQYEVSFHYEKREAFFKKQLSGFLKKIRKNRIVYSTYIENEIIFHPPKSVKEETSRRLSHKNVLSIVNILTHFVRNRYKHKDYFAGQSDE